MLVEDSPKHKQEEITYIHAANRLWQLYRKAAEQNTRLLDNVNDLMTGLAKDCFPGVLDEIARLDRDLAELRSAAAASHDGPSVNVTGSSLNTSELLGNDVGAIRIRKARVKELSRKLLNLYHSDKVTADRAKFDLVNELVKSEDVEGLFAMWTEVESAKGTKQVKATDRADLLNQAKERAAFLRVRLAVEERNYEIMKTSAGFRVLSYWLSGNKRGAMTLCGQVLAFKRQSSIEELYMLRIDLSEEMKETA